MRLVFNILDLLQIQLSVKETLDILLIVSLDVNLGGNVYARKFILQYFNNGSPINNGLVGEETESITVQ